jgi:hypothetical protein
LNAGRKEVSKLLPVDEAHMVDKRLLLTVRLMGRLSMRLAMKD